MVTRFKGRIAAAMAGAAASFVFAGTSASAQQIYVQAPVNLRVERVGYWDLNLASRAGEQRLYRRVGQAVEHVCQYDNGRWYGLGEPDYTYCSWGAMNRARPQVIGAVYRARQMAYYRGY
jgi:UrcA family protein